MYFLLSVYIFSFSSVFNSENFIYRQFLNFVINSILRKILQNIPSELLGSTESRPDTKEKSTC